MERSRNGRRGEREDVDLEPQRAEELLLRDPEPLLLVEDDEPEVLRDHVAREDAVRSDQHVDLALLELLQDPRLVGARAEARHHLDAHGEVPVALAERVPVLLGEDRRRAEHERLATVQRDGERGADGDLGLAEADVAADEPIHRTPGFEVLLDCLDRLELILRLAVRERALESLEPVVRQIERLARRLAPARVEREQLAGELPDRGARPALEVLPRLSAELGQRRRLRVRPDVARDFPDLLVRDVEAVLAAEGEEEVVARDAGDVLRLEAEETADAVILVHDVVADPKVGEGLERATEARVGAGRALAEDLRVRKQGDPEVAPDEASPRRADDEGERTDRGASSAIVPSTVASTFRSRRCVRSASPWCGKVTTTRRPCLTIAASSFSASASPRAAIAGRCASNTCGCERGSASSRAVPSRLGRSSASSSQRLATSSTCQTRSGAPSRSGTRSCRRRPSSSAASSGRARAPG